jgi:hypothetical protein
MAVHAVASMRGAKEAMIVLDINYSCSLELVSLLIKKHFYCYDIIANWNWILSKPRINKFGSSVFKTVTS